MIDGARHREQEIREPVDVSTNTGVCRGTETDDAPFGPAADGPGHVESGAGR